MVAVEKKKPMIVPGKGRVLTIAEAQMMFDAIEKAHPSKYDCPFPPAHVDPRPTIAPGKLRPCGNCGELCEPHPDGMCDGCHEDAAGGCDGPEEITGDDPSPEDE